MDKEGPMMKDGKGDPMKRECAMCKKGETPPDAKEPTILTVYSSDLGKYMCADCYNSMKEMEDYAAPKSAILVALGGEDD